jgi:hypothetical protein
MRPLVAALFAVAVGATVLAGDGLVLVPHTHAPGTPLEHPHGLALYRFPIALLGEPADAPRTAPTDPTRSSFRMSTTPSETLVGASLLLLGTALVIAVMASRRLERAALSVFVAAPQWSAIGPTGPPRALPIA